MGRKERRELPLMNIFSFIRCYQKEITISFFLLAASLAVYFQVKDFSLVLRDDIAHYAHFIGRAQSGIDWSAITTTPALFPYWVPLTFLTHLIDAALFGDNPGWHHLSNVAFHTVSAILLFLVLRIMTNRLWESALVGALFAVHPLNVASVVWLGNRSAMVSTVLCLLLIAAYVYFLQRKSVWRYLLVVLLFVSGLLARPSVLWLPPMLLLLDYWPLGRLRRDDSAGQEQARQVPFSAGNAAESNVTVIIEKIPLFLLGAGWFLFSLLFFRTTPISVFASGEHMDPLIFLNAFVSCLAYLGIALFPAGLPAYSPYASSPPQFLPFWLIAFSILILGTITLAVVDKRRRHPYLVTGWGWYLIGIAPYVTVCVAQQAFIIERYAYVPLIGIFIILTWGGRRLAETMKMPGKLTAALAMTILMVLAVTSWQQAGHWKNSVSYFRHAVRVHPDCAQTRLNFGEVLLNSGRLKGAVHQFQAAVRLNPASAISHTHLGDAYARMGEGEKALHHYQRAVDLEPGYAEALNNLANLLMTKGKIDPAIGYYRQALRTNSRLYQVHNNLATALAEKGEYDQAIYHLKRALALQPHYETARQNLDRLLFRQPTRR